MVSRVPPKMSARSIVKKKKPMSKSKRADVIFPVARLHRFFKEDTKKLRIGVGAAVYAASVLEYLVAEVMELAGNTAKDNQKVRITPRHILVATSLDQELHELMKGVTIPSSGVLPRINPALLQIKPKNRPKSPCPLHKSTPVPSPVAKTHQHKKGSPKGGKVPAKMRVKGIRILSPSSAITSSHFSVLSEKKLFLGQKLVVVQADITKVISEAVVHPTNASLALYGQVGQALEKEGGQKLRDEVNTARQSGNIPPCGVVLTQAHNLSSKWIIHVNGPNHSDANAYDKLEQSVKNCLVLADTKNLTSIALPSIGSGKAGFPKQQAAQTILKGISNYFATTMASSLKIIYFVLYDMESIGIYTTEMAKLDG